MVSKVRRVSPNTPVTISSIGGKGSPSKAKPRKKVKRMTPEQMYYEKKR